MCVLPILLVLGEAGVGKSRLAEELAAVAECDHDALLLEGRCVPYGEANVWWPIADALRYGCGIRAGHSAATARELAVTALSTSLGPVCPEELHRGLPGILHLLAFSHHIPRPHP